MTIAVARADSQRRRSGWLRPGDAPQLSDHACSAYATDEQRAEFVTSWLTDALATGQRAMYVGNGTLDTLQSDLAAFPDVQRAITTGQLVIASVMDLYDLGEPIQPDSKLALYDAAVERAITDGYRGLRVAADITPLVADERLRASHLHWEQLADRYMTQRPLAPLCIYDQRRISSLAAIAAAHPLQGPHEPSFTVFGCGPTAAAIEGEVDACVAGVLVDVLRGLPATDRWLNVERLTFLDARCAAVIHDEVRRRTAGGSPLTLVGASGLFRRVWELCRFDPLLIGA